MPTRQAVAHGIRSTAGVVTSAAIIMVAVFAVFGTLTLQQFKQLAVGLAVSVLIDATVVRAVLLPSVMALLGDRNWYLPRWLAGFTAGGAGPRPPAPDLLSPSGRPARRATSRTRDRRQAMDSFFKLIAAGPAFFVSAWLLMLFAGAVSTDVGVRPFGYLTSMVVTIALWLTVAPAIGAVAGPVRNPEKNKENAGRETQ